MEQEELDWKYVVRDMYETAKDAQLTFLAAALAFYSILSMFPIILLTMTVGRVIGQNQLGLLLLTFTGDYLTPGLRRQFLEIIQRAAGGRSITILGFLILIWSAFRIFRGLDAAFTMIYHTRSVHRSLRERVIDNLVVMASITLMGLVVGLSDFLLNLEAFASDLFRLVSLFILTIPVFYVYPTTEVTVQDVVPGALLTASVITFLRTIFRIYTLETTYTATSVIGAFMLFTLWFYAASSSVLLGGLLNQSIMKYRRVKRYE